MLVWYHIYENSMYIFTETTMSFVCFEFVFIFQPFNFCQPRFNTQLHWSQIISHATQNNEKHFSNSNFVNQCVGGGGGGGGVFSNKRDLKDFIVYWVNRWKMCWVFNCCTKFQTICFNLKPGRSAIYCIVFRQTKHFTHQWLQIMEIPDYYDQCEPGISPSLTIHANLHFPLIKPLHA
jgi:hypothetical protein